LFLHVRVHLAALFLQMALAALQLFPLHSPRLQFVSCGQNVLEILPASIEIL
jgi:hypothetical protein